MRLAHLLLALAAAATAEASLWADIAAHARRPIVQTFWESAHLPCTCEQRVLNCSDRSLLGIAGDLCPRAAVVDVSHNQLTSLPHGLDHATALNASGNRLSALPEVQKLNPRIKHLDLSANRIKDVTQSYRSLGSLEVLNLNWNAHIGSLWFLPNPCGLKVLKAIFVKYGHSDLHSNLRECRLLEKLDLEGNAIHSLPSDTFSTHWQLRDLILAENPVGTIEEQQFRNLTRLQLLNLRGTHLNTLPATVFDSLTNLRHLDLSKNLFQTLPNEIFSRLTHLTVLKLSDNKFESLPIHLFQDLQSLHEIHLSNNKLKTIPDGAFQYLVNIKEVYLSFNKITNIGINLFSNESNIEGFVFNDNPVTNLSHGSFRYYNLPIAFLPCLNNDYLSEFSGTETIYISQCGAIHWQSRAYVSLGSVKRLVIGNHKILSIANDTFDGLHALEVLDISHNEIMSLPESIFSNIPNLKIISLFENNITSLPENIFHGLVQVIDIILESNQLSNIPENVFQGLLSLERIDLSRNKLTSIPRGLFNNLPSLNEISVEGNMLATLPPLEANWPRLRKVSLSLNRMTQVPETALRSWLDAEGPRFLSMVEEVGYGGDPSALSWLLDEPGVTLGRGSEFNCRCGNVRKGDALVFACVNADCSSGAQGSATDGWVGVLRASRAPTNELDASP